METLIYHYAYGKPTERVELDGRVTGRTVIVMRQLVDPTTVIDAAPAALARPAIDEQLAPSRSRAIPEPEKP
jgi:hypothetical protein